MTKSNSELLPDSGLSDSRDQLVFVGIVQAQLSDYQQLNSSKTSHRSEDIGFLELTNCPALDDIEYEALNTVPDTARPRIDRPQDAPLCVPNDATYTMLHAPDELRETWTAGGTTIRRSLVRDENGAIEANLLVTSRGHAFQGITIDRSGAVSEYGFLPEHQDPVYRTTIHPDGRVVRINRNNEAEERFIDPSVAQERIAAIRSRVYGTRRSH